VSVLDWDAYRRKLAALGGYVSLAGSAAMSIEGGFDAVDQDVSGKGLGQKANGSGLHRSGTDAVIGKSRDENKRRLFPPGAQVRQQVQTAHNRHLHIRNDA
jgi:hypothetical protein